MMSWLFDSDRDDPGAPIAREAMQMKVLRMSLEREEAHARREQEKYETMIEDEIRGAAHPGAVRQDDMWNWSRHACRCKHRQKTLASMIYNVAMFEDYLRQTASTLRFTGRVMTVTHSLDSILAGNVGNGSVTDVAKGLEVFAAQFEHMEKIQADLAKTLADVEKTSVSPAETANHIAEISDRIGLAVGEALLVAPVAPPIPSVPSLSQNQIPHQNQTSSHTSVPVAAGIGSVPPPPSIQITEKEKEKEKDNDADFAELERRLRALAAPD